MLRVDVVVSADAERVLAMRQEDRHLSGGHEPLLQLATDDARSRRQSAEYDDMLDLPAVRINTVLY